MMDRDALKALIPYVEAGSRAVDPLKVRAAVLRLLELTHDEDGRPSRTCCVYDAAMNGNTQNWLKFNNGTLMAAYRGYRMIRAGSITGMSAEAEVLTLTTAGNLRFEARVNGTTIAQLWVPISATGAVGAQATWDLGTYPVAAGDVLAMWWTWESGSYNATWPNCVVEVTHHDD